MKAISVKKCKN